MTERQDARKGTVESLRHGATTVGLIWGGGITLFLVGLLLFDYLSYLFGRPPDPVGLCWLEEWVGTLAPVRQLTVGISIVLVWVSMAVAWRWQAIGAILLVLTGLAMTIAIPVAVGAEWPIPLFCWSYAFLFTFPCWVVAILFLASWWKSRSPKGANNTE